MLTYYTGISNRRMAEGLKQLHDGWIKSSFNWVKRNYRFKLPQ